MNPVLGAMSSDDELVEPELPYSLLNHALLYTENPEMS